MYEFSRNRDSPFFTCLAKACKRTMLINLLWKNDKTINFMLRIQDDHLDGNITQDNVIIPISLQRICLKAPSIDDGCLVLSKIWRYELLVYNREYGTYGLDNNEMSFTYSDMNHPLSCNLRTHYKFRSGKKEEDTWSVIVKNLTDIKYAKGEARILLRANYNFELLSCIDEYIAFLAANFNSSKFAVFFYPIKKWGGENDSDIDVVDDSLYLLSSTAILNALNKYNLRSDYYIEKLSMFSHICYAGDARSFYINVNGDIQKCSLFPSPDNKLVVIGTIGKGKFDINEISNIQYTTPDYNLMKEKGCYQCEYLPLCYGLGCPYAILREKEIKCMKEKYDMEGIIFHDYKTRKKDRQ